MLSTVSVGLVATTAALGESAAVPVGPGDGFPPYAAHVAPSPATVTALLLAAALTGAAGVGVGWWALRRGWAPPARRVAAVAVAASVVALGLAFLPHVGTADPESYAAYGRIAATGGDPYRTAPDALAGRGDPYGTVVEPPWQHTTSVYGPVATWEQQAAAQLAGDDPRTAVWLLDLAGALAFAATSLLLWLLAVGEAGRRRVVLLWAANPLLLWQLVAGGHVDTLAIAGAVGAFTLLQRRPLLAGALAGAAVAVKLPAALVGAGLAWGVRRSPRHLVPLAVGAVGVLGAAYASAGSHSLDQVRVAARFVSRATPWKPLASALDDAWGTSASRHVVSALAALVTLGLVVALARAARRREVAAAEGRGPRSDAAVAAAVLVVAWLFAAPYALPWYDGLAWALVVLLAASRLDLLLLAHTAALSAAYLPGRVVPLPGGVADLTSTLRGTVAPLVLAVVVVVTAWSARPRRPATRRL